MNLEREKRTTYNFKKADTTNITKHHTYLLINCLTLLYNTIFPIFFFWLRTV
jgi:hypothetical protein